MNIQTFISSNRKNILIVNHVMQTVRICNEIPCSTGQLWYDVDKDGIKSIIDQYDAMGYRIINEQ